MLKLLILGIVLITLALLCYTVGVWAEKIQKDLKLWHIVAFILGLVFDSTGTSVMSSIAKSTNTFNPFHAVTGGLALVLMLIHAIWAIYTFKKGTFSSKEKFHKFSLIVWLIWLVPYLSGAIFK